MIINYRLSIETKPDTSLPVGVGTFQSIRSYDNLDGIQLRVEDTELISNAFKKHKVFKTNLYKRDGVIFKQEGSFTQVNRDVDLFDIEESIPLKEFFKKYSRYIVSELPRDLSFTDEVRYVTVGTDVRKSDTETPVKLVFRDKGKLVPVEDKFDISLDRLLSVQDGFYQILPRYSYNLKEYFLDGILSTKEPSRLSSDVNLNIDGCVTNRFYTLPDSPISVTYSNDYTVLTDVELVSGKEYIIFELKGDKPQPLFYLTPDHDTVPEAYTTLMESHTEFKRKYLVIANKATLRTSTTEYEVTNTYFDKVKNQADKVKYE